VIANFFFFMNRGGGFVSILCPGLSLNRKFERWDARRISAIRFPVIVHIAVPALKIIEITNFRNAYLFVCRFFYIKLKYIRIYHRSSTDGMMFLKNVKLCSSPYWACYCYKFVIKCYIGWVEVYFGKTPVRMICDKYCALN
jgi:hypothetical protein